MDPAVVALVEQRMNSLEARISALESESSGAAPDQALQQYKQTILGRLKQIREVLASDAGLGMVDPAVVEERDVLRKENERMRRETEKLKYRVAHLIRSLNEEEQKNSEKKS